MDEQVKMSQETSGPARKSRRTWLVMAACVLVVAVGARVWYVSAASSYQEEQEALRALKSLFHDRGVLILAVDADPGPEGNVADVAAEIRLHWASADWLRSPIEAIGEPILQRVEMVTIYEPNINDSIIDLLGKFSAMKQLALAPDMGISRDGFGQLRNALPNTLIWIEHDKEGFGGRGEENEDEEEEDVDEADENEEDELR